MPADLVTCTTEDKVRLHGLLREPSGRPTVPTGVLCLHGAAGNFYASPPFDGLDLPLSAAGHWVLRANTRGHDILAAPHGARVLQGVAHELVEDCLADLAAWIQVLRDQGCQRIGLIGHSLGGVKSLLYATRVGMGVDWIVPLSPPMLSYRAFEQSAKGEKFLEVVQQAQAFVAAGEPQRLMEIRFPVPITICAGSYLDKYGPAEKYNFLPWLDQLKMPVSFVYGALELPGNPAFEAVPGLIRQAASRSQTVGKLVEVSVLEGANHSYTGTYSALWQLIEPFIRRQTNASEGPA